MLIQISSITLLMLQNLSILKNSIQYKAPLQQTTVFIQLKFCFQLIASYFKQHARYWQQKAMYNQKCLFSFITYTISLLDPFSLNNLVWPTDLCTNDSTLWQIWKGYKWSFYCFHAGEDKPEALRCGGGDGTLCQEEEQMTCFSVTRLSFPNTLMLYRDQ